MIQFFDIENQYTIIYAHTLNIIIKATNLIDYYKFENNSS